MKDILLFTLILMATGLAAVNLRGVFVLRRLCRAVKDDSEHIRGIVNSIIHEQDKLMRLLNKNAVVMEQRRQEQKNNDETNKAYMRY